MVLLRNIRYNKPNFIKPFLKVGKHQTKMSTNTEESLKNFASNGNH